MEEENTRLMDKKIGDFSVKDLFKFAVGKIIEEVEEDIIIKLKDRKNSLIEQISKAILVMNQLKKNFDDCIDSLNNIKEVFDDLDSIQSSLSDELYMDIDPETG